MSVVFVIKQVNNHGIFLEKGRGTSLLACLKAHLGHCIRTQGCIRGAYVLRRLINTAFKCTNLRD